MLQPQAGMPAGITSNGNGVFAIGSDSFSSFVEELVATRQVQVYHRRMSGVAQHLGETCG